MKPVIDHYAVLGVGASSTAEEIKDKYRTLVKEFHPDLIQEPDKKKEAEEKIKCINSSYDIIGDENKRKQYDLECQQPQGPPPGFHPFNGMNHEDIINFFRAGRPEGFTGGFHFQFNGQNINVNTRTITQMPLEITSFEAILGIEKEVSLPSGKKVVINIPAGIQANTKLRIIDNNNELHLVIVIVTPILNEKQHAKMKRAVKAIYKPETTEAKA